MLKSRLVNELQLQNIASIFVTFLVSNPCELKFTKYIQSPNQHAVDVGCIVVFSDTYTLFILLLLPSQGILFQTEGVLSILVYTIPVYSFLFISVTVVVVLLLYVSKLLKKIKSPSSVNTAYAAPLVGSTVGVITVTLHDALRLLPSVVVAVIIAVPSLTAVTVPFSSTVATSSLLLVHDNV